MVQGFEGFLICRLGIGLGLATFVACQFWMSCMFNRKCVGLANATAAGWGNLGGGVAQFLMPLIYRGMTSATEGRIFSAWRWAYLVPGLLHTIMGVAVMFVGQDLPDGNYKFLHTSGQLEKKSALNTQYLGIANNRMWCMVATYGFCFGVELTMNNIVAAYLYDQFELDLVAAGTLASCYGLMNIFARSLGGVISDTMSLKFGMRGRLWTLWVVQTLEGILCVFMALAKDSLATTILFMVLFSICVQASEGASYGIVPYITRRALGVASGYIGAGGNAGSTICMALFFTSASIAMTASCTWASLSSASRFSSSPSISRCGVPCSSPAIPTSPRRTTTSRENSAKKKSRRALPFLCRSFARTLTRSALLACDPWSQARQKCSYSRFESSTL